MQVVELSDGEDTEQQLLVTGKPSSKSQINGVELASNHMSKFSVLFCVL